MAEEKETSIVEIKLEGEQQTAQGLARVAAEAKKASGTLTELGGAQLEVNKVFASDVLLTFANKYDPLLKNVKAYAGEIGRLQAMSGSMTESQRAQALALLNLDRRFKDLDDRVKVTVDDFTRYKDVAGVVVSTTRQMIEQKTAGAKAFVVEGSAIATATQQLEAYNIVLQKVADSNRKQAAATTSLLAAQRAARNVHPGSSASIQNIIDQNVYGGMTTSMSDHYLRQSIEASNRAEAARIEALLRSRAGASAVDFNRHGGIQQIINQNTGMDANTGMFTYYFQQGIAAQNEAELRRVEDAIRQENFRKKTFKGPANTSMQDLIDSTVGVSDQKKSAQESAEVFNILGRHSLSAYQSQQVLNAALLNTFQSLAAGQPIMQTLFLQTTQSVGAWKGLNTTLLASMAAVGVGVAALGMLVRATIQAGDAATMTKARLAALFGGQEQAESIYQKLQRSGLQTGVSAQESGAMMVQFSMNRAEIGASDVQLSQLVENMKRLGITSGATTQMIVSGMRQFGQSLAAGRLNGDELRSVLENIPLVAKHIANEMGVSIGMLRELGAAGRISADVMMRAMLKATTEINTQFEKMPMTFERGWNAFNVGLDAIMVKVDKVIGVREALADFLAQMGRGMYSLANPNDRQATAMVKFGQLQELYRNQGLAAPTNIEEAERNIDRLWFFAKTRAREFVEEYKELMKGVGGPVNLDLEMTPDRVRALLGRGASILGSLYDPKADGGPRLIDKTLAEFESGAKNVQKALDALPFDKTSAEAQALATVFEELSVRAQVLGVAVRSSTDNLAIAQITPGSREKRAVQLAMEELRRNYSANPSQVMAQADAIALNEGLAGAELAAGTAGINALNARFTAGGTTEAARRRRQVLVQAAGLETSITSRESAQAAMTGAGSWSPPVQAFIDRETIRLAAEYDQKINDIKREMGFTLDESEALWNAEKTGLDSAMRGANYRIEALRQTRDIEEEIAAARAADDVERAGQLERELGAMQALIARNQELRELRERSQISRGLRAGYSNEDEIARLQDDLAVSSGVNKSSAVRARASSSLGVSKGLGAKETYTEEVENIRRWRQAMLDSGMTAQEVQEQVAQAEEDARIRMLDAQDDWASGVEEGFLRYSQSARRHSQMAEDFIASAMDGATQSFTNFIKGTATAGEAFNSFVNLILDGLLKIYIQSQIVGPLAQAAGLSGGGGWLTSLFSFGGGEAAAASSGGSGGGTSMLMAAKGAAFSTDVIPFARGGTFTNGIVTSPTLFKFGSGGGFGSKLGVMGEAGPEAIAPLFRSSSGHLGVKALAPMIDVQIIDMRGGNTPPVGVSSGQGPDGKAFLRVMIADEVKRLHSTGMLDTTMKVNHGINRAGVDRG